MRGELVILVPLLGNLSMYSCCDIDALRRTAIAASGRYSLGVMT